MNAVDPAMAAPLAGPAATAARRGGTRPADDAASRYTRLQLILGIVAIAAAAALVVLGAVNRSLQGDVAKGQARIGNAQAAANVNNTLIRLLAKAAAEKNDERIRALLAQNGISFRQAAPADPGAAPTAAPLPTGEGK